jgi:ankyrin repeat protein
VRVTKRLLALGADANSSARGGARPLHIAAAHGNVDCVKLLLDVAAVDALDDSGRAALHVAALRAQRRISRRLLAAGAQLTLVRTSLCVFVVFVLFLFDYVGHTIFFCFFLFCRATSVD